MLTREGVYSVRIALHIGWRNDWCMYETRSRPASHLAYFCLLSRALRSVRLETDIETRDDTGLFHTS
jgi:hypothetical protein